MADVPNRLIIAIAFVNAWQFMGYQFSLLYAGVKSTPEQYMEAATIDGCSRWMAHLRVTLPLMKENYKFCFIVGITSGIGAFIQMLIMTNGGPGTSNYTLTFMIYRYAFSREQLWLCVRRIHRTGELIPAFDDRN